MENYEQKYKEIVERVKELHDAGNFFTKKQMEIILPQLAESEDEKIRKVLVSIVKWLGFDSSFFTDNSVTKSEVLAYLEKQKESGIKWFKSDNLKNPDKPYIDKAGMFYTTDGRMCYASEIEKHKEQKPAEWSERYIADVFENVGLAKIVREQGNDELTNAVQSAMIELSKGNKQEWSEEDERMINVAIKSCEQTIEDYPNDKVRFNDCITRLKSLPERFNLQSKQEWSEEDSRILYNVIAYIGYAAGQRGVKDDEFKEANSWLKSLRPQSKQD